MTKEKQTVGIAGAMDLSTSTVPDTAEPTEAGRVLADRQEVRLRVKRLRELRAKKPADRSKTTPSPRR